MVYDNLLDIQLVGSAVTSSDFKIDLGSSNVRSCTVTVPTSQQQTNPVDLYVFGMDRNGAYSEDQLLAYCNSFILY